MSLSGQHQSSLIKETALLNIDQYEFSSTATECPCPG
jgi:hypothetical protein